MNVLMTLEMAAECHPERIAATCGERSITYGRMLEAARRAGARIRASGCRHVGFLDVNSLAAPVALYAAACAGLPYVPMNYRLTKPEIRALLQRIAPAWLVADPQLLEGIEVPDGFTVVDREQFLREALDGEHAAEEPAQADPAAVAVQLFTSGTTGAPKAAVLRHENLMSYILGTVEFVDGGFETTNEHGVRIGRSHSLLAAQRLGDGPPVETTVLTWREERAGLAAGWIGFSVLAGTAVVLAANLFL